MGRGRFTAPPVQSTGVALASAQGETRNLVKPDAPVSISAAVELRVRGLTNVAALVGRDGLPHAPLTNRPRPTLPVFGVVKPYGYGHGGGPHIGEPGLNQQSLDAGVRRKRGLGALRPRVRHLRRDVRREHLVDL